MPLSPELVSWFKEKGYDAFHVVDWSMQTSPDSAILNRACKEDRIVITADLDYPRLFALLQIESPGLILFRGGNFSEKETRALLERVINRFSSEEIRHSVIVLEKKRMRRRQLPIK